MCQEKDMDNRYRRDHQMPYYTDESVIKEQLALKKIIREYNTVMPFDPERGMQLLDLTGMQHGKGVYFEPPFHCEYGSHITVVWRRLPLEATSCLDLMSPSTRQDTPSIRTAEIPGMSMGFQ